MSPPESDPPPINPAEPRPIDFAELRRPVVRQVGQLMAAAAMTAPKSGGQLLAAGSPGFLETVLVEDPATLTRLAEWMRARGAERREAIWFRDADAAQGLDGVLFIGLVNPYPPNYDCGACGYATCAEFLYATKHQRADATELEFTGPHCTLRSVDLGVALSLSLTHKAITFDRRMPDIDYDTLNLPTTGTLPLGVPGATRAGGARNKQQPRQPTPRQALHPPPTTSP